MAVAALSFDLPSTIPLPSVDRSLARRARGCWGLATLAERLPVPPRRHDERVRWRPAEVRCCLPWLRDEQQLDDWLATRRVWPGSVAAYWSGNLAADREHDARLDLLARAVLLRSSATVNRIASSGHGRGSWLGSGDLVPFTRRVGPGERLYCVTRTTPPPWKDWR